MYSIKTLHRFFCIESMLRAITFFCASLVARDIKVPLCSEAVLRLKCGEQFGENAARLLGAIAAGGREREEVL